MHEINYKIGEVSEILGIEQHTLRYLENSLKLKIKRDERGDRLYSETDLDTFKLILQLKNDKGLNTTAIKLALDNMEETKESDLTPSPIGTIKGITELASIAHKIVEQNNELLQESATLQKRINELEEKITKQEKRREERIEELIILWRNEQDDRNKSWLSKLKRK